MPLLQRLAYKAQLCRLESRGWLASRRSDSNTPSRKAPHPGGCSKGHHVARARRGQRTHHATQSPLCLCESFWMRGCERYWNFPRRHKGPRVRQSSLCVLFENGTTQTTELLEDQLINTFFAFILGTRQQLPPTKNAFAVGLYNFRYGRVVHNHHKGRTFVFLAAKVISDSARRCREYMRLPHL